MLRTIIFLLFISVNVVSRSACTFLDSNNQAAPATGDALRLIIERNSSCPTNVFAFRDLLKAQHLILKTTLVANRGFHNPSLGSFSLFEIVTGSVEEGPTIESGEFFFGHFTDIDNEGYLIASQEPTKGALMIEAIAWDYNKKVYNFYELRGDGEKGQWFYRGDSLAIFADNQYLHRQLNPKQPQFGKRLRCSGCHGQGGPIMKEIYNPYNDWWTTNRPLDLGGRKPDTKLAAILTTLVSAKELANHVNKGVKKLSQSYPYTELSWQEQLRPLFCPVEVNFVSDALPNDLKQAFIAIPSSFFIDERLLSYQHAPLVISRADYEAALTKALSHFPETAQHDADHAWLAPVKALSDQIIIQRLVDKGLITNKFVADVLAIDITNPIFSTKRCALLRYLPDKYSSKWLTIFKHNLKHAPTQNAKELLANLTDPSHNPAFYQQKAEKILYQCQEKLKEYNKVETMCALLSQRRLEIGASEISANPLGQILEPGFRVIFPDNNLNSLPAHLEIDEHCEVRISQ
ncbi:hypothetical protein ACNVED_02160 [Legionella sp. D16C41]|uniref:hypothetical protein n=1 Tax=Legionella sp. D16C41 TaxID=3402688 RepID=UPI003AF59D38